MAMNTCADVSTPSGRKVALLIGNADYQESVRLPNTLNDVEDLDPILRSIDFEIHGPNLNSTLQQMKEAFERFRLDIHVGDIALIFFAGHGIQWEVCMPMFRCKLH